MTLLILVCLINEALLVLGTRRYGLREALVVALVGLCAISTLVTEALSLGHAITFRAMSATWFLLAGLSFTAWRRADRNHLLAVGRHLRSLVGAPDPLARFGLIVVATILAVTLLTALRSPPNTWDAMTYHLPRVAAWIQHGSIDFFPTSITRQDYQPPLAGFLILQLQVLSRSDAWANLPQWSAFLACIILVSLIVKDFGQPWPVQVLGALAMAALPAAILQSSGAQTDLVCSAFCLATAYFLMRLARETTPMLVLCAGFSAGLALLSKGTAYLYLTAIGLTLGPVCLVAMWRRSQWATILAVASVAALAVVLNAGHWARTHALYGTPLSGGTESYICEEITPVTIGANLVRNVGLHLGTLIPAVDDATTAGIARLLGKQGRNPKISWNRNHLAVGFSTHEDSAGNLLHLFLFAAAGVMLLRRAPFPRRWPAALATAVVLGALLFSACLKWQAWGARLHLPLFALAMPVVAAALAACIPSRPGLALGLAGLLSVTAAPFLLNSVTRPLMPQDGFSILNRSRMEITLHTSPKAALLYPAAMQEALRTQPAEIGLILGGDDWEYPLWVLAGTGARAGTPRLRHVLVDNETRALDRSQALPDVLLCTRPLTPRALAALGYDEAFAKGDVRVLRRPLPEHLD